MTNSNKTCPVCKSTIKTLKHSTICKCGRKLKNVKTIA